MSEVSCEACFGFFFRVFCNLRPRSSVLWIEIKMNNKQNVELKQG